MDTRILIAGGTVAGLVGGAAAGYFYAVRKLTREYDDVFTTVLEEQLEKERDHYKKQISDLEDSLNDLHNVIGRLTQDKRVPKVPEGVAAGDGLMEGPDVPVLERVLEGLKKTDPESDVLKYHFAGGSPSADRGAHIMGQVKPAMDTLLKTPDEPLMVTEESFNANEQEYYEIQLTYFADGILIDENENVLDEVNILLGEKNVKQFPHIQDDVVYICNHKRHSYFEVALEKRTSEEVLGTPDGP